MYKKLADGHWLSDEIVDQEVFPMGGTFPGYVDLSGKMDIDKFQNFFDRVAKNQKVFEENKALKKWFSDVKIDFDYSLFCHMFAFNAVMAAAYPDITQNMLTRNNFYDKEGNKKLSEAVAEKKCACAEYSVLAQAYFQSQNIPTRYVGGELVSDGDFDNFEPHSFIVFQSKEKEYVFDPVNPINLGKQRLPRIAEFVGKKDDEYLETKCLFNSDKWFYAGGRKGEFLQNLPTPMALIKTLEKRSNKVIFSIEKDKLND